MKYLIGIILALIAAPVMAAISLSLEGVLSLIVYLVIVGLIFWCIWWFLSYVGVPEPFNKVLRVILGLLALVIVVNLLLGLIGSPMFSFH